MNDAQFLCNSSVICEVNHIKRKTRMQGAPKSGNFRLLEAAYPPLCPDLREISQGQADPRAPRPYQISHESVQESPLRSENADFRPLSKFNNCRYSWLKLSG